MVTDCWDWIAILTYFQGEALIIKTLPFFGWIQFHIM